LLLLWHWQMISEKEEKIFYLLVEKTEICLSSLVKIYVGC